MIVRHFGIQSGRSALGGMSDRPSATRDAMIPRGSILVPTDLPFKRGHLAQALIDITALIFGALFISSVAASIPVALFLLVFCKF